MIRISRKTLIATLVAFVAIASGIAWRFHANEEAEDGIDSAAFFEMKFNRADGSVLAMSELRGKPLVINFWATWCTPCVHEMPQLDRFQHEFGAQGWQVVGLAVDKPEQVRSFIARLPVSFQIALAGEDGTELLRELGNSQGGLPFSVVLDRRGRIVHHKLGETSFTELSAWAGR
jgi:thiol-disulfide isomerase/thioredoxin